MRFVAEFLCIRGTGKCWNPQVQAYTDAALARFRHEWEVYFRAELPVDDRQRFHSRDSTRTSEVTQELGRRTLVVFGDPASNPIMSKLIQEDDHQPTNQWNEKEFNFGGQKYASDKHVPASHLSEPIWHRYLRCLELWPYLPRGGPERNQCLALSALGDFAILKPTPTAKDPAAAEVIRAGLFDENWKVPAEK